MKMRYFFLTLFSIICFTAAAQQNMQQKIAEYLSVNGTELQYNAAYDAMFEVLEQQFADVPNDMWNSLKGEKKANVNQVVIILASAYRKHFNEQDIDAMLAFYKTDTGRKLAGNPTTLNKEENKKAALFYGSEAGQKMKEVRLDLEKDIAQISEYWSRDLYKAMVDKLKTKGYQPKY